MTTYEAVVFDNDGVLVELTGMNVLRAAARAAFADHGITDPPDRFVERAANGDLDGLAAVEDHFDLSLAAYWASREEQAVRLQTETIRDGGKPLYEDVPAMLDLPHDKAVVSNNQHGTVQFIVDHYGLADDFDPVIGREHTLDGANRRKPEPHYLDRALDALGTRDALYVGDSPKDVEVAHRAHIDSAFLRRDHRTETVLDHDPTYEVETLSALADQLHD